MIKSEGHGMRVTRYGVGAVLPMQARSITTHFLPPPHRPPCSKDLPTCRTAVRLRGGEGVCAAHALFLAS